MVSKLPETMRSVLSHSRLAALPKPIKGNARQMPVNPIVHTSAASRHRLEWGLKAPIPGKMNLKQLELHQMDCMERITMFEHGEGPVHTLERIRQLNVPFVLRQDRSFGTAEVNGCSNPLFTTPTLAYTKKDMSTLTQPGEIISATLNLGGHVSEKTEKKLTKEARKLREEFRKFLVEKKGQDISAFYQRSSEAVVAEFLAAKAEEKEAEMKKQVDKLKYSLDPRVKTVKGVSVAGTGGISYALGGRLKNSPNGVQRATVVPGRLLNFANNSVAVGVAGVVGSTSKHGLSVVANRISRAKNMLTPKKFVVSAAEIVPSGSLNVQLESAMPKLSYSRMRPAAQQLSPFKREISPSQNEEIFKAILDTLESDKAA